GALVLRIAYEGGLIAPNDYFQQTPTLSVYADGRLLQPGATDAIYPGPLLPHLQEARISPASIGRLLDAAAKAGLTTADVTYPAQSVADVPDTVITVVVDGRTVVSRFGALGVESGERGTAEERAARAAASTFVAQATDLRAFLGADALTETGTYPPTAIRLLVRPGAPPSSDPSLVRLPVPWPLATPLATFGAPLEAYPGLERCGAVTGTDLPVLLPVLEQATQLTGFSSGGAVYTVVPRPLLPDEAGC
ncbi:MAG: hypothetical protein ACXWOW_08140, partial [Candidatus Limnocylindrales bacterium]